MNFAPLLPAVIIAITAVALSTRAADPNSDILARYEPRTHTDTAGKTLLYRLAKPDNFDKDKSYPLVLYLHGAGGRGADNTGQIRDASPNTAAKFALPKYQEKFPCFIVAPQCPRDRKWVDVDWAAASHTAIPVPLWASGPGAEAFGGKHDNAWVGQRLAALLSRPAPVSGKGK